MKKVFALAVICSMAVSGLSGIRCVYAESADITCNVDGKSGVSNVGQDATPLVTINFGEAADESTLDSTTVKLYKGDEEIDYTPYSVSADSYVIDLMNFSSFSKNNSSSKTYIPDELQECRIEMSGVKLADGTDTGDKSFEFSTSLVLPVSYTEGCVIENVALGKNVAEIGTGSNYNTDKASINDGIRNESASFIKGVEKGAAACVIDLGRQYSIAGVAIAGAGKNDPEQWYNRAQLVGGSNEADKTVMKDVTEYIGAKYDTISWKKVRTKFYDYGEAEPVRYIYAGSVTTAMGSSELYVWAYVPELVDSTIPKNNDENVSNVGNNPISDIEINFFNRMDVSTLIPENIVITDENGELCSYDEYTADSNSYKIPITELKHSKKYTVTVTGNVLSESGIGDKKYEFSFTTGAISKGSKPISEIISDTYPRDGSENVTGEESEFIEVYFGEKMEESTISAENIKLYEKTGKELVYENSLYENNTYKIPIGILESNAGYTVKISGVMTDEGVESDGVYEFSFETGAVVGSVDISELFGGSTLDSNSDAVTNVGDSAYIDVFFNKKVDADSLKNAVMIIDSAGSEISGLNHVVSDKQCGIDKGGLKSDTEYTLVIYKDKVVIPGMTITGKDIEIPFKTAYIFDEPAEVGTKIINVSKNKTVLSANDKSPGVIVDGNIANCYQISDDTLLIDLGGYYELLAVRHTPTSQYNYANRANYWHTNSIKFWTGNEKDFSLKNFTNFYTTTSHEESILMSVPDENRYARFIAITNPTKMAVIGEIEVYARVGMGYGVLSGSVSGDECDVSLSILNFSGERKQAYAIFCEYNSSDKLIAVNAQEIILDKEENDIRKVQKINTDTSKVKVFISTDIKSIDMQTDALVMSR